VTATQSAMTPHLHGLVQSGVAVAAVLQLLWPICSAAATAALTTVLALLWSFACLVAAL
jgi:hypothetical protein